MIKLRPHHGLCIQHFIGKGYSEEFVKQMTNIIKQLEEDEQSTIELTCSLDEICKACPHNLNSSCESGQKVIDYDEKCLELCDLKVNTVMLWKDYKHLIRTNIISCGKLPSVCVNCQWIEICTSIKL